MEFAIQVYKWLYDLILVLVIVSHGDDPKKLKLNVRLDTTSNCFTAMIRRNSS